MNAPLCPIDAYVISCPTRTKNIERYLTHGQSLSATAQCVKANGHSCLGTNRVFAKLLKVIALFFHENLAVYPKTFKMVTWLLFIVQFFTAVTKPTLEDSFFFLYLFLLCFVCLPTQLIK